MKKAISFALMLLALTAIPAQASVTFYEDGTRIGAFSELDLSTGMNGSKSGNRLTVTRDTVFEGTTADAFETTLDVVDPTADNTVKLPDNSGTVMTSTLATNSITAANSVWGASNGIVYEGATADAFETTLSPADPTADQTALLPDFAVGYALLGSTLTTNNISAANSIWAISNGLVFEGATADAFEATITPVDLTADASWSLPNFAVNAAFLGSTLTTNNIDAANSIWAISNGLVFEGATADAFELTFTLGDPTADQTVTVPPTAGAAGTVRLRGATVVITAGASPTLTVPLAVDFIATDTIVTDNQDQTINASSGGTLGQRLTMIFTTDSGGSADEVITFGTNFLSTGTLTLANLTADRYNVVFESDGTVFTEVARTIVQTT